MVIRLKGRQYCDKSFTTLRLLRDGNFQKLICLGSCLRARWQQNKNLGAWGEPRPVKSTSFSLNRRQIEIDNTSLLLWPPTSTNYIRLSGDPGGLISSWCALELITQHAAWNVCSYAGDEISRGETNCCWLLLPSMSPYWFLIHLWNVVSAASPFLSSRHLWDWKYFCDS